MTAIKIIAWAVIVLTILAVLVLLWSLFGSFVLFILVGIIWWFLIVWAVHEVTDNW